MNDKPQRHPKRLIDGDPELGPLLRQEAETRMKSGLPFEQLLVRRQRRRVVQAGLWASAAVLPLCIWFANDLRGHDFAIVAESPQPEALPSFPAFEPTPEESPSGQKLPALETTVPENLDEKEQPDRRSGKSAPRRAYEKPSALPGTQQSFTELKPLPDSSNQADCREFTRSGAFEQALACYDQKSNGTGMSAELALLEGARISWRALRSPKGAIERLQRYDERFSRGALRREARLLEVEVLRSSGDYARARNAIVAAIEVVPERSLELRKQAFDMAVRMGNCDAAQQESQALLNEGVDPGQLESVLSRCHEGVDAP